MSKFSLKYLTAAAVLMLSCSIFTVDSAWGRESNEDMHISSPLFDINDVWPEKETNPSIDPVGNTFTAPEATATVRRANKENKKAPEKLPFVMPPVNTPQDLVTSWGYGGRENLYNGIILKASSQGWPHSTHVALHPLLLKSLLACESGFDPTAVSYTGALGIAQITPDTARRFGLSWSGCRNPNQAIPVGVKVLAEKAKVVIDPGNYHKLMGLAPEQCLYASNVAKAYEKLGAPTPQQYWYLMLGAYNGGGGTILRAMSIAWKQGKDPREWSNLVGDPGNMSASPLYLACTDIYKGGAAGKYRELSAYPVKIINLYNKSVDQEYRISR